MPHSYGLIRQKRDPRDFLASFNSRLVSALPPSLDLSIDTGPLLDQGSLGSCGPNTAAENIDYDQLAEGITLSPPSRLFIYYNTRMLMGTVNSDSGVDNRTMMKALAQYGYCDESLWPYADDPTTFTKRPPIAAYAAGQPNRISNYAGVQVSLGQIKAAIFTRHLVIFGTEVFQGIESDQAAQTGIVPDPSPTESPVGGHDISLVGWDDLTQRFKFRNHWVNADGTPWGDGGYGYFSYKYATNIAWVSDLWMINSVPGQVTPPQPPPVPPSPPPIPPVPPSVIPSGTYTLATGCKLIVP